MARPVLEELREQTSETVSLSLLEGRAVRLVDCVEGRRAVRVGDRTGVVLPAHCTAAGKAILAAIAVVMPSSRAPGPEAAGPLVAAMARAARTVQELLRAEL